MKEKYHLYDVVMKDDLSDELIERMAEFMNIPFNRSEIEKSIENEDLTSSDSVCIFRDKDDPNRLVLLDGLSWYDYLHEFVVVCRDDEHEEVKQKLLEITNEQRIELGQEALDISDIYNEISERNSYYKAMKRIGSEYPFEIDNTPSWKKINLDKNILLNQKEGYYQYETLIETEYIETAIDVYCSYMQIFFDSNDYSRLQEVTEKGTIDNILVWHDERDINRFIMIDKDDPSGFNRVIVRCDKRDNLRIKELALEDLNYTYETLGKPEVRDIENTIYENNGYEKALKRYGVECF